MIYKSYFSKKKINQEIFNKKLNWYFDIKSILFQKNSNFYRETIKQANILKKNYVHINQQKEKKISIRKKTKQVKKVDWKKYTSKNDRVFKNSIKQLFIFLKKEKIQKYFKHFVVHGSFASKEYIKGWSDLDTFVVIKNEILFDTKKIIRLRKILKKFYLKLIKISKFQHHGLILYTENDLKNYLNGYLPMEALQKSFSILNSSKICINFPGKKKNLSLSSLKDRYSYLKDGVESGKYKHHSYRGVNLDVPLKTGRNQMYQLFCHIGYVLNFPILYFDATNRSIHKKDSFKFFYKEIKDEKIKNLIKKSEQVRKLWSNNRVSKNTIPKWVVKKLGDNYMHESLLVIKKIIKLIHAYKK